MDLLILMGRAVRLKKSREAVNVMSQYIQHHVQTGNHKRKLARAIFRLSGKDNVDIDLMYEAEKLFECEGDWPVQFATVLSKIASAIKPYEIESVRKWWLLASDADERSEWKGYKGDQLAVRLIRILEDAREPDLMKDVSEITFELFRRGERDVFCAEMESFLEEKGMPSLIRLAQLILRRSKMIFSTDGFPHLLTLFSMIGADCQGQKPEKLNLEEMLSIVDGNGEVPAGNWVKESDRRFDGSWLSEANMCLMYKQYGRVHEDDEGVIYQTKGGWKPVVKVEERKGIYMVQSRSDPRKFYEVYVCSEHRECECSLFLYRHAKCHHIEAVEELLSDYPFEV